MLEDVRVHPAPGVPDAQSDVASGTRSRTRGRRLLVDDDVLGVECQRATAGHRVARVHREIDQNLLDLPGVGEDRPQAGAQGGHELDVLPDGPAQQLLDVARHAAEVHHLGMDDLAAAEGEELAGERGGAVGRLPDALDVGAKLLPPLTAGRSARKGDLFGDQRRVDEDHAEEVVEVVGDAPRELSQALQPLRLLEPVLEALPFRLRTQAFLLRLCLEALGDLVAELEVHPLGLRPLVVEVLEDVEHGPLNVLLPGRGGHGLPRPSWARRWLSSAISFLSSIILSSRPTVSRWNRSSSASLSSSLDRCSAISASARF